MTILTKTNPSKIAVIITAAGSSTRMGGSTKKEYLPYKKGTVLSSCARTFLNAFAGEYSKRFIISDFIVTCPQGGAEACKKALCNIEAETKIPIKIVEGAETRQRSVYNGLLAVKDEPAFVLIHDGARPFITKNLILSTLEAALNFGASVPGIVPTDTQKEIDSEGFIVRHLVRSNLRAVQTPQCFEFSRLLKAHGRAAQDNREYTDDTEIWGEYCGRVKIVDGDVDNIKITYPADLERLSDGIDAAAENL